MSTERKPPEKICAVCGMVFTKRVKQDFATWNARATCSRKCTGALRSRSTVIPEIKRCHTCKRDLPVAAFDLRTNGFPASPCRECKLVKSRVRYRLNPNHKSGKTRYDPVKRTARNKLQRAVRDGKIIRQPCEVCGAKAQAHHEDYSKPLEVRWLCAAHHGIEHWKPTSTPILERARSVIETAIRGKE